jgi:UrcA family protein
MMKSIVPWALAAAIAVTGFQTAAFAGTPAKSVEVRVSGLDLANPAGQAAFDRKLRSAARQVCSFGGYQDLRSQTAERACEARAIADAQPKRDALVAAASARQQVASLTIEQPAR